jgi:hypothetical protein
LGRIIQKPGLLNDLRAAESSQDAFEILLASDLAIEGK